MNQSLKRKEIIRSKKKIDLVFQKGDSITHFPIKTIYYLLDELDNPEQKIQLGFSVPKRNFKRAVDRNLLKRRMKEAYRKNKFVLNESIEKIEKQLLIFFVYIGNNEFSYQDIEDKIVLTLQELKLKSGQTDK